MDEKNMEDLINALKETTKEWIEEKDFPIRICNHQWFEIAKISKESDGFKISPDGLHREPLFYTYGVRVQCANCGEVKELAGESNKDV